MATSDVLFPPHPLARPSLSPRTPRFNLDEGQQEPLLHSPAYSTFSQNHPPASEDSDHYSKERPHRCSCRLIVIDYTKQFPLGLVALAISLLLLTVIIYNHNPDQIRKDTSPPSLHQAQPTGVTSLDTENIIDYSNYSSFPLTPLEYATECWKLNQGLVHHKAYWAESEDGFKDVAHVSSPGSCNLTITYQLDQYSGLFAQLALLAQIAALAREQNRTLLIDDRYWDRGRWLDHFVDIRTLQPGPEPGCKPPPAKELVACPRLARHWIINSRTAKFHFGQAFEEEYHDAYAHSVSRQRPIFNWAHDSILNVIIPNEENRALINAARKTMGKTPYLGIHIRRGDNQPMSWRHRGRHVPLEEFARATQGAWSKFQNSSSTAINVWIATDSVDVVDKIAEEFPGSYTAFSLSRSVDSELKSLQPTRPYVQSTWDTLPLGARIRETRGVIVDFALLSGAWSEDNNYKPEAVICTMTSNLCTLGALPMGWIQAFEKQRWVEIDNGGSIEPVWRAYTLF